ncbi:MAG: UDP-3-O-acyl-N-acetylglucosamine deacetylase [Fimbriimonadaceae bacterium]|nr:UDP-3-O-acyl-N-acetylglucosamine deacetylase [Fimbriimonadaceae bacterium]
MMVFDRLTVRSSVTFEGGGLHSGSPVSATVHPGRDGIAFRSGNNRWIARPDEIRETVRCTRLGDISTIEHLMSALAGIGITDAEVEVQGGELPAAGGSSFTFVEGLQATGHEKIGTLEVTPPYARIFSKCDERTLAIAAGEGHWRFDFVTNSPFPGVQSFAVHLTPDSYCREVAPARTIVFEAELDTVRRAGLGQGLDERTALVLGENDYVNPPLFSDEPARHKLLDLIGDLYLSGVPMQAVDVIAERSGHSANVEAAARLAQATTIVRY